MLSPSAVANAKPGAKPYKLADERGMFLLVNPTGSRWWRFKYRRPGTRKENLLSLGTYPDVSLKRAREKRDEARRLLADGIDPGDKRKAEDLPPRIRSKQSRASGSPSFRHAGRRRTRARCLRVWRMIFFRGSATNRLRA